MTIALNSEVVGSRSDKQRRLRYYTIERDGKRWTVEVPFADLDKHKKNHQLRRNHVATCLLRAMAGPPDPRAGTKTDPHKPQTFHDFDKLPAGQWYVNAADGRLLQKP